jgi:hypothetical protein
MERSEDNLQWIVGETSTVLLERLTPVELDFEKFKASWESLTDKEFVRSIWMKDSQNMSMDIKGAGINKSSKIRTREFGPLFSKIEHNKVLYLAMKFSKSTQDGFRKEGKVKENKWALTKWVQDYPKSIKGTWNSLADSKAKSVQWLLINHALPVGSRIIRNGPSPCRRCNCQYSTLKHVFEECPRAQAIWAAVNEGWEKRFKSPLVFDFRNALNPGADKEFSTKVYDTVGAITVHQIWLDYCAITHDNPKGNIPELELGDAILSTFFLTMKAELGLLKKDFEWWLNKEQYSPGILSKGEVEEALSLLQERIGTIDELLKGYLVLHLGVLGPSMDDVLTIFM